MAVCTIFNSAPNKLHNGGAALKPSALSGPGRLALGPPGTYG